MSPDWAMRVGTGHNRGHFLLSKAIIAQIGLYSVLNNIEDPMLLT